MDEVRARFRLSVDGSEIEIEGREEFVREHLEKFGDVLEDLKEHARATSVPKLGVAPEKAAAEADLPGQFGEYLQRFPQSATQQDKFLIAAYWSQVHSADGSFATADAKKLLIDQGIKVGAPSTVVSRHKEAKRVFVVKSGRYKVSQLGIDYISSLMEG